ncbi:MAG: restriction endonuclease subunit S [Rhodanobacteraceae bacterium]|nr:restriction endonuclease subunit S [Rhodanobacteraceae bacterium]
MHSANSGTLHVGERKGFQTSVNGPSRRADRESNLNAQTLPDSITSLDAPQQARLPAEELLFAKWSATPGTSFGAHIWSGADAVLNQHIFRVDFNPDLVEKRFFKHAINEKLAELIDVAHGGVGLRHVTKGVFERTEVPLPPLPEQERIADKLDALLARVDACRERLDRIPAILKRFRQSVLAAATSGELTREWREERGLSSEWSTTRIVDIAYVGTGSTPLRSNSSYYAESGTPWITSSVTGLPFVTGADEFVTDAAITAHRLKVYPVGTLIVALYGEGKTRGQVTELRIAAAVNQACAAICVDQRKAEVAFVRLVLEANYLQMRELAEGGNQPNLNLTKIKEFQFSLPSILEQNEITRRTTELFQAISKLEVRVRAVSIRASSLTPATLAKAFRGELVPQDPNDEPAAALLARIAAQRDHAPPAARGRGRVASGKRP